MLFLPILLAAAATDPGLTKVEMEQAATRTHARLDINGDGFVTYEEARQAGLALFLPKEIAADILKDAPDLPIMHREFDEADTDHDGRLSLAEEIAEVDRRFDAQDTDHDGRLTIAERMPYMSRYLAEMQAELAALPKPACRPGAACSTFKLR